jgi:hypothetical protein
VIAARALALVALVAGVACGGGKRSSGGPDVTDFECNERRIEYMVVGGFAADEAGVRMDCAGGKPVLTKWRLEANGERRTEPFDLSGEQFDATWEKVEATGWRFLDEKCANPGASPKDPIYSIDVGDGSKSVSLSCTGKELPFPYDRLVNELDLRAAGFGDDSGPAR